ncbi:MAG: hypothetical protein KGL53_14370, partial [Elusimicrobia bacterium]|nr:hypothetical protein [Elusimicrobiota bacterium]
GFFASKSKEGVVRSPSGLALDEKGTVFVADSGNRRVDGFGTDGSFKFTFGPVVGPYELKDPVGVAYDDAGFVYVLDAALKKVIKCEPSGGYVKAFGEEGDGVSQFDDPEALAFDGKSWLYVLDRGRKRVMVFDRDGRWVTNFFAGGRGKTGLDDPSDLIVSGSELLVADPGRGRVAGYRLKPRLAPPPVVSTKAADGEVTLSWAASADPWASRYHIWRATQTSGPWQEAPAQTKPQLRDSDVEVYKTYWYRVAVEAATGDVGAPSRPVEVFVPGSFNVAPVEISTASVGDIFSANYKWYLKNPLGKAVVQNNLNVPFHNVKVSFRLKDFMDFATETTLDRLGPKEKVVVPLAATLNNRILDVSEDTPVQAEITLTYYEKGDKRETSLALPLRVYSRRAITWEDPRRIANFLTPNDPPVDSLEGTVLHEPATSPPGVGRLNVPVVDAARLWAALSAGGVRFAEPPNNPFEKLSQDPTFPVDYTQFPRDTLARKSGDCDMLAALFSSLLENAGVTTALLDYPGHMAMMFDTKAPDVMEAGLPADMLIPYQGTMWVPVETTMVGEPFEEAVRKAAFAYKDMSAQGKAAVIDPREAWKVYEPATLPKSDQPPFSYDAADAKKSFESTAEGLLKARYAALSAAIDEREKADGPSAELWDQRGVLEQQFGRKEAAVKAFKRALELDAGDAAALNDLGNYDYEAGRYAEALDGYKKAAGADPDDGGIWMNLTRTALKLGKAADAKTYAGKAVAADASFKEQAELLLKP